MKDLEELSVRGEDAEKGFKELDEKYDGMVASTWVLGKKVHD